METSQWLTIQEYSNKHNVSISTLRRKIKSKDMEYSFKNGRYLIRDEEGKSIEIDSSSFKELKTLYQSTLTQKEEKIINLEQTVENLQAENEDLNHLVQILEQKPEPDLNL